jgi:hypothetical protein
LILIQLIILRWSEITVSIFDYSAERSQSSSYLAAAYCLEKNYNEAKKLIKISRFLAANQKQY